MYSHSSYHVENGGEDPGRDHEYGSEKTLLKRGTWRHGRYADDVERQEECDREFDENAGARNSVGPNRQHDDDGEHDVALRKDLLVIGWRQRRIESNVTDVDAQVECAVAVG